MILSSSAGTLTRLADDASEVLSLTDLKDHLRIDETADHDVLLLLITAVRKATEEYLSRTLIDSTWTYEIDDFPKFEIDEFKRPIAWLQLPMGPITAITTLEYYDDANVLQTFGAGSYEFDRNGRMRPVSTSVWPSTYDRLNAVKVTYTAGVADAGQVDEDIKLAMRLMIGHYEQNRENSSFANAVEIPDGFKFLLNAHRTHRA